VGSLAGSADDARRVLATMWTIRRFEEAVDEMFARGLLYGTMHLSIGQEASATGACATTTSSPRPTAATATASPRAPTSAA
jgi:TPP-dependent pyruvate/acetoin dehydrogenase alpha subunit